ncbi:MAG: PqqD family protein [Bacteroidales bacterium]|nr:PqqD family protein [Bacteroidales bacterium]
MQLLFRVSTDVLSNKIDDELVLMSPTAGFYYSLDPVGSRIWELLSEKPSTVDELADRLMEEYEVDRETCLNDVLAFIDDMAARKLIVPSE